MSGLNKIYSAFSRKFSFYLASPYLLFKKQVAFSDHYIKNPPVLVNSFPKSGTHLLYQVVKTLPQKRSYGRFIASIPSFPHVSKPVTNISKKIAKIIPGEICRCHLEYNAAYSQLINKSNMIHYFIYRDPRDVVVSEAFYLNEAAPWHGLAKKFQAQKCNVDRIKLAILGLWNDPNINYPNIAQRFQKYAEWLNAPGVISFRYEDLMTGNGRDILLMEIAHAARVDQEENESIVSEMNVAIVPEKSHTFRVGKVGGWADLFTDELKNIFKSVASDLLINLGYEIDNNW